jgi:hypothetical protein
VARQLRDAQSHTIWEGTENVICLDILRALRSEQVLRAAFETLEARGCFGTSLLDPVRQSLTRSLGEVRDALRFLSRAGRDLAQLRARSFCNYLADVVQGALLLEEAQWELEQRGSARKALVAHLFAEAHLRMPAGRGITSTDRSTLDFFHPLTRYDAIEPALAEVALRGTTHDGA